ncbi:ABR024Cp [Eremothecium gossypii ATCC 10895]|uniref:Splicing factor YJU2 n=1 Tax=Eremothecium gossypii (strain ATCC 10895 / CBS 109.51 / FGSC 9923 / NRRL Y-1056) TaxID=284811 RepID=Q75DJ8_EREGS|nr:ABR024Cp [Eremothecium gossypii ATCC 10895]AAS50794.1 ABR024Cp [Eremothecium gossypii ATCC 10895]AEY95083.1 FABR024Cp [Eremothecium gossypii FDAG1]
MSERKAINKYYPPDYDPEQAERQVRQLSKKLKTMHRDTVGIRLMTPFSMRCLKCSEYIPKFRKFNGKKELLPERYLDTIKIYRLSIRCPRCNSTISFRTDPNRGDYTMEAGGERNYVRDDARSPHIKPDETTDETLQRLLREEAEAARPADSAGEDRMQELEKRLARLQQEQHDAEEIDRLHRESLERGRRAASLAASIADRRTRAEADAARAEEAFRAAPAHVRPTTAPDPTPAAPAPARKPAGKNPLGVVVRNKKKQRARLAAQHRVPTDSAPADPSA